MGKCLDVIFKATTLCVTEIFMYPKECMKIAAMRYFIKAGNTRWTADRIALKQYRHYSDETRLNGVRKTMWRPTHALYKAVFIRESPADSFRMPI